MTIKFANNVSTTLANSALVGQTTMEVASVAGFPTLALGDYFYGTLTNNLGAIEIVEVTSIAGNILTCVRGAEGTAPQDWTTGATFEIRVTAAGLTKVMDTTEIVEEVQTATSGQTVFTLTTFMYAPGENTLSVYLDGVNQIAGLSYEETSPSVVTFADPLHLGALVKFTTLQTSGITTPAAVVIYEPAGTGAVATTVQAKLRESVSVFDFMTAAEIADVQARTGLLDVTTAIAMAILGTGDVSVLYFPAGYYGVSTLKFNKAQMTVYFDHAAQLGPVVGYAAPTTAVVVINNTNQTFHGLNISTALNVNYTAALQMASVDGTHAEFTKINGLFISDSHIGVLYGSLAAPVDAPISENYISGYWTYNVGRCLYANQTNGWLMINHSTLVCGDATGTAFPVETACAVENINTELFISDSELLNVWGTTDYLIKNSSDLLLSNVGVECPSRHFLLRDASSTQISNYTTVFWNNATQWLFNTDTNATLRLQVSNSRFTKNVAQAAAGNGVLLTNGGGITAKFSNCVFDNFTAQTFVTSAKYVPASSGWSEADVSFSNCIINDSVNSLYLPIDMSNNLASYYALPDIAKFTISTTGTGATAAITTVSADTYTTALTLVSVAAGTVEAATKIAIDNGIFSQTRFHILTVNMGVSAAATAFNASILVTYYDNAGNSLATQSLRGVDGGVANLKGIPGVQANREMRTILSVPVNAAQIQLSFIAGYAGDFTWNIGNIRVY